MSTEQLNLFSGEPQHDQFCRMDAFYPVRRLSAAAKPQPFPVGQTLKLPEHYRFGGANRDSMSFLEETDTSALLAVVDGKVCFEEYYLTGGPEVPWTSWSVAKSFVSALVGIAIEEGLITSVEDPIDQYLPGIKGSAYEGVSIRNALQMSSGADWNEDYSDPDSDSNRLQPVMAGQGSLSEFVRGIKPAVDPGTRCQYNSADTQVLGLLLAAVKGTTLSEYMQQKLCEPLGFEHPGYWLLDAEGVEMALGGLNLTARDYARIGELYRNNGRWAGQQLVPESWVSSSIRSDAPHLEQGRVIVGGHVFPMGYGYQWWVPAGSAQEFSAVGIYNQFVFVNPKKRSVIVKLSANRAYGTSPDERTNREEETVAFLRAINDGI
ncbi:MAG TPA: class C beta-lactamase-related serine hydrolase [Gemmatimonadetes bacterium]|nr:class C beta-lactamase-related serine hydrolase [Gemmatimonadota bacterium]